MRARWTTLPRLAALLWASAALAACGSSHTGECAERGDCAAGEACVEGTCQPERDGGAADAGAADAGRPDAGPPGLPLGRSVFGPTAGGGSASSGAYRAQIRIGPPQPVREAQSPSYRLRLFPGSR